jgi:hypothetical protein
MLPPAAQRRRGPPAAPQQDAFPGRLLRFPHFRWREANQVLLL